MRFFLIPLVLPVLFFSCDRSSVKSTAQIKTVDQHLIDSVIKYSDSSYVKPYKRTDFVNSYFYINKKDSSVCQLMKDSSGTIRQMIIARKNTRTFFAQYYVNGQLQADLPLDEFGQYHGTAIYYYQNGIVQSRGVYFHGLKAGTWKNFDERGKFLSTDEYDSNGQLIKSARNN